MPTLVTSLQGYSIHDGPGIRTVVFFKGCALKCQWCSNPECINPLPEIGLFKALCTNCGKCAGVCPSGALIYTRDQPPSIDRRTCTGCGLCSSACAYKALVLYGQAMTAEEIFESVKRDEMFYRSSGGGITVSGGEALLQPDLISELLRLCRQHGIHTAIETSGCAAESSLRQVLPLIDYVLYDLKIMNCVKHRHYTGQANDLILSNAGIAAQDAAKILFRMPLIPGVNDDEPNIRATAVFLAGLGERTRRIELMPYHRLGKGKYDSLAKEYIPAELTAPAPAQLDRVKQTFEDSGITCTVSG